jgi:hypothetical protein
MKVLICIYITCSIFILSGQKTAAQDLYSVSPVSFNTRDYDEYACVPYKDGLVFCSNRPQNLFIQRLDSLGLPLSDYYFVKRNEKQKWGNPKLFSHELNSRFNEAPLSFNDDYKIVYFGRTESYSSDVYSAIYNGITWEQITPFAYNELKSKTAQPFLSSDGQKLFFSSNRRGGFGGFDLYECSRVKTGQWSKPKNLGPEINSTANEEYPFLHKNGKLYFASNRKDGIGGFDIYYTQKINGKWIKPVLLPVPLNSKNNDVAYTSDSLDRNGYVSSDRNNRRNLMDIFEFTMNFPVFDTASCKPQKINKYTYTLEESSSFDADTTSFKYEWDFGDGKKYLGRSLKIDHKFPGVGDYLIQLNVIDTLTGKTELNQASHMLQVRDYEQPFITCPDTAKVGEEIIFDGSRSYLPDKTILNYYWDFNDGSIAVNKEVKHTFTQAGVYKIILGVTCTNSDKTKDTISRFKKIIIIAAPPQ